MVEKTTSLKIDEDVWRDAKHLALDEGMKLSDLVEQAIRSYLKGHQMKKRKEVEK